MLIVEKPRRDVAAESSDADTRRTALESLGMRAREACGGLACIIAWRGTDRTGVVYTPAEAHERAALAAVLALAERQFEPVGDTDAATLLAPGQLAPLLNERLKYGTTVEGAATRLVRGEYRSLTVLLTPVGRSIGELEALARLTNESVCALVAGDEVRASRDFWMSAGSSSGAHFAEIKAELAAAQAEQARFDAALARCAKARPRQRFAVLGAILAEIGPFEEWLVATSDDDGVRVAAASPALAPLPSVGPGGPLAECLARDAVIVRTTDPSSPVTSGCDRLFAGFPRYLCVPCAQAAIALATRRKVEAATLSAVERLAARLRPVVEKWLIEAEADRLQRLVRGLGLRMFGAVDRERQRIARDLHDHLTQLLAAARIALEADPARTRAILRELDESLRQQLREIRPATLGRATLRESLGDEMSRLAEAGIRAKLILPEQALKLPRMIQELCYQVAREAVSNVLRHAGASRVELRVTQDDGQVALCVEDNGKGLLARADQAMVRQGRAGVGLAGMAERLELMGGRLRIERHGKVTQLTAEIPDI